MTNQSTSGKLSKQAIGSLGGKATVAKYGVEHMRAIGKLGAKAFYRKYHLSPVGTSAFAIVDRVTGKIKGYTPYKPEGAK